MFATESFIMAFQESANQQLTAGGWAFLVAAWAFILILTFYTFGKILRKK